MVEPKTTRPLAFRRVTSMISEFDKRFSMSLMRPSMKLCCSRAAWYSAFSLKSPCARASAIALMTFGRASLLSCFSPCRSRSAPRSVIGVRLITTAAFCAVPWEFALRQHFLVQVLQPIHFYVAQVVERVAGRARAGHRRVVGYLPGHRFAPNRAGFAHRLLPLGGIDDQCHLVVFYHIDDVGATLSHLIHPPPGDAGFLEHKCRAAGSRNLEAARDQHLRQHHCTRLVAVAHADEA